MIKIGKNISSFSTYFCRPDDKNELKQIIQERMKTNGDDCDLNDIDVSLVTDMSWLFACTDFNGDISKWNTSNVTDMSWMFNWSKFNGDISKWDVNKANNLQSMFERSKFNNDISRWKMSSVKNMSYMFCSSQFNQDISNWKIRQDCATNNMFHNCSIKEKNKPKSLQK